MTVPFTPINNNILVKMFPESKVTVGGLHLPEVSGKGIRKAEVVAVGSGKLTDSGLYSDMQCAVGDTVMLHEFTGIEVELEDGKYRVVNEDDVIGILK